eukprot:TRINITY_DN3374_c0_g1_i2.p1 TRINITY_DN3374_c0_g1~~TRINITY_DN3374_c0_g1_i2.p1  ORF type:complete len:408 (-),score=101.04 TRINITY_DN3374_c0_g1_i2:145-1368(-)
MATNKAWKVEQSESCKSTVNLLRVLTDTQQITNPSLAVINLSIGDPTIYGNFKTHEYVYQVLADQTASFKYNGYASSVGHEDARKAVAELYTAPEAPLTSKDIILANGASGALEIAIMSLCNPGDNMLIPLPAFSLYECIAASAHIDVLRYKLLPEKNWEADIEHMKSLINSKTKCILVNNPSNPCGSVYTAAHLKEILAVADEYKIPIIADEIYADMTFSGYPFHMMAHLTSSVPIISVGGISKRYLVPGWRLGWIIVQDKNNILKDVTIGMTKRSQLILGPNTLVQSILPRILKETPQEFYDQTNTTLAEHSKFTYEKISAIHGLKPVLAQGAMYQMVELEVSKLNGIADDLDFQRKLLAEQSVFILPGCIFGLKNFFRIVITATIPKLTEAYQRMSDFCEKYKK